MKIALKVDANTFRGTRYGVPRLMEILKAREAGATFLFSLGPDQTGRAIGRVFRAGFLGRVRRTSVFRHYGFKTLLYGTLLPGPDIGQRCADIMREARDAGFEVGIRAWNRILWDDKAPAADAAWTLAQMTLACDRFQDIFGEPARVHGAAGWQMNRYAYRLTQRLGFSFSSDTRGSTPFVPVYQGEIVACPQLPTSLPTLDELIGNDGVTADTVVDRLLEMTAEPNPVGHVFTLHAELEGMKLAPVLEKLLDGWRAQGHEPVSLGGFLDDLTFKDLPRHEVGTAAVPGRGGQLAAQGREFLADAKIPPPIVERRVNAR